ncbi:MAG TPA: ATP-binding cassette domain-containing protein [Acholeplasmataceae bacterium]|nr:ATP-binding cassette domain-containing protein [Acholeplasmataceae bacterium]
MLELINISKEYRNGKKKTLALTNINVSFRSQEFVCVVGPSGCGKTTLLNIIGGLDNYSSGDLLIRGKSTKQYKSKDWDGYRNQAIGFVFQNYNLIPQLTVYENVELALTLSGLKKNARKEKILKVLQDVGLEGEENKYPNQLSGGQMQRVAIARAIINNPEIILADEPTGALDSKTAKQIVELLKEISKKHLVIMVTHNKELANTYATRIITLLDGSITLDTNPHKITKEQKKYTAKRSAMKLNQAIKLSFKNLLIKKLRTILIVIAGSVGIISVTLVLTISHSVKYYMEDIQKVTLSNEPITIRRQMDYSDPNEETLDLENYPDSDIIPIVNRNRSYYRDVNNLSEDFINHLYNLDEDLYNFIDLKREVRMNIFTAYKNEYKRVSSYAFTEMSSDLDFVETQYDLLYGKIPTEANEIALLIDINNSLDARVLSDLLIEYENRDSYTFSEIMKKEYSISFNDDYFKKHEVGIYFTNSNNKDLYEKGYKLKITGILRPSRNNSISLYQSGILYTPKLTDLIVERNLESDIVMEQLQYGLSKDVLTGKPFEDEESAHSIRTKEYLYELQLTYLGIKKEVSIIRIYTDSFSSRNEINDHLKKYNENQDDQNKIYYYDYIDAISREFDAFVRVLTKVLIIFSAISLFVSAIMTGIITYVSVMERIKEIGILRSIGARKIDIANVFNAETGLIGFTSGILGITLGILLIKPIVKVITNILKQNNITTFDLTQMDITKTNPLLILLILLTSIVLTLIAGIIPAILAALKSPTEAIRNE